MAIPPAARPTRSPFRTREMENPWGSSSGFVFFGKVFPSLSYSNPFYFTTKLCYNGKRFCEGGRIMPPITNDWADYLKEEFGKPYYRELYKTIMKEYQTKQIFPPADDIFNAFHFTPVKDVK